MAISLPTEKSRLSCLWPPRNRISRSIHFVDAHRDAVPAVDNFESPECRSSGATSVFDPGGNFCCYTKLISQKFGLQLHHFAYVLGIH